MAWRRMMLLYWYCSIGVVMWVGRPTDVLHSKWKCVTTKGRLCHTTVVFGCKRGRRGVKTVFTTILFYILARIWWCHLLSVFMLLLLLFLCLGKFLWLFLIASWGILTRKQDIYEHLYWIIIVWGYFGEMFVRL